MAGDLTARLSYDQCWIKLSHPMGSFTMPKGNSQGHT